MTRRTAAVLFSLAALAAPLSVSAFDEAVVRNPAALANVQSVFVAPAVLELPEGAHRFDRRSGEPRAVSPRDAESKAADLVALLKRGFAKDFTLANAPGPGVLVITPTLQTLESSRPTLADYNREPGLSHESVFAGGATLSVRMERDGEEVATLKDRYQGSFGDGSIRIGVWQDTDRAFDMWSRQLPRWVEQPKAAAR